MKLRNKVLYLRSALSNGTLAQDRPRLALIFGWGLSFILGFVLSSVPIVGRGAPFGIALTAVIGGTLSGLFAAVGASLAYLSFLGVSLGARYVATVFLTFTASYVFQELGIYRKHWFMPCIAALFTLLTGLLSSFMALDGGSLLTPIITQTLLTCASAYFFREALSTEERTSETAEVRHTVALLFIIACFMMALSGAVIGNTVSVGRVLSITALLVIGYKCGAVTAAAAGMALGFAMDAAVPDAPFYAMAYGASGIISAVFSKHGRLLYLLSFILTSVLCVFCISFNGIRLAMLYEASAAGLCFLLIPGNLMTLIGAAVKPATFDGGETALRRYTARRVEKIGDAFRDLYATVDHALSTEDNAENITAVFDRASDLVCSKCKNKNQCWNTNYIDTLSAFNDTVEAIRGRGLLLGSDLPAHFLDSCLDADSLINAVNGELRARMYRQQFRSRIAENRTAAYSQYLHVSEILSGVSDELSGAYGPDPLAQRRLQRYLSSIDVEADASAFRDRNGRLHIHLESTRLKHLMRNPGYLDQISDAVGVRLCRPNSSDNTAEGKITLLEAEPFAVSVGIASMKKKGESVSGDRGTYFKTEQGILCIILSDGMGSGENAAKESVAAVRLMERFLRAGVNPAVAMQLLNSMMLIKNEEGFGVATVDLMCIDLFTGETVFYKYGAAPSYVRCGKVIKRIRSDSLAAGLSAEIDTMPDIVRMTLRPGSVALIASDGVLAETKDEWLRALLREYEGNDTKALARSTLQAAVSQYGCSDDMTVLAVRIESRS